MVVFHVEMPDLALYIPQENCSGGSRPALNGRRMFNCKRNYFFSYFFSYTEARDPASLCGLIIVFPFIHT
jgi:hypothetical protein